MKDTLIREIEVSLISLIPVENIRQVSENIVNVVVNEAVHSPSADGRNILSVSSNPEDVFFIDTVKAFMAIVGVIGGVAAVATTSGITAIAAGAALVGTLAAFKGLKVVLPRMQGLICHLLITSDSRRMYRNDLRKAFVQYLDTNPLEGMDVSGFSDALTELRNLGCLTVEDDEVILKQTVVVRK